MKLSLTFSTRLALLAMLLIMGLLIASGAAHVISRTDADPTAAARISTVIQDLIGFIIPALILALLLTRLPADFLRITALPRGRFLLIAAATLLLAIPAIEYVNALCARLPWSSEVLNLEAQATQATATVLGPHTGANLILSILIVGILTGLAEELLFRGALMQTLLSRPMSTHLAVWLTAIIFSLMHAQMIGFIPRTLLGAFFGYSVILSGSLWTAVILHAINNTAAILTMWAGVNLASTPALAVASAAFTAAGIYLLCNQSKSKSSGI